MKDIIYKSPAVIEVFPVAFNNRRSDGCGFDKAGQRKYLLTAERHSQDIGLK
jgi:hypothetical protein